MFKRDILFNSSALVAIVAAFDPGKAGWKVDDKGNIVMKDGNPVYVDANGAELAMGVDTITRLNTEAKNHRTTAEQLREQLNAFKDIDPAKARDAMDKLSKIDQKKLIDAGEVDRVRDEIKSQFTVQLDDLKKVNDGLTANLNDLRVNNVFANSDFIRSRIAVPRDMFEASFRKNFKVDDKGNPIAYDNDGNRLMSKTKGGEYATPEEALEILVERHPQKDVILKADGHSGSGNNGGGGGNNGRRVLKRSEFEKLNPVEKASTAAKQRTGEVEIVD